MFIGTCTAWKSETKMDSARARQRGAERSTKRGVTATSRTARRNDLVQKVCYNSDTQIRIEFADANPVKRRILILSAVLVGGILAIWGNHVSFTFGKAYVGLFNHGDSELRNILVEGKHFSWSMKSLKPGGETGFEIRAYARSSVHVVFQTDAGIHEGSGYLPNPKGGSGVQSGQQARSNRNI